MGERTLLGYERYRTVQHLHPVDGKLHVTYFFGGEQEWTIHVSTTEYEPYQNPMYQAYGERYWRPRIHYPRTGVDVEVFSLDEELYGTLPLRGDLHMHTDVSDAAHSPARRAAKQPADKPARRRSDGKSPIPAMIMAVGIREAVSLTPSLLADVTIIMGGNVSHKHGKDMLKTDGNGL